MSSEKINSIWNKKNYTDRKAFKNLEDKRSIEEIAENLVESIKEEYEMNFEKNKPIIEKAKNLLLEYKRSDSIPEEELEKTDFDEAKLLAFCKVIEERVNQMH